MTAKHTPATPLPWTRKSGHFQHVREEDIAYFVHAANAYPRLVETLRELMLRCDGEEGTRADGSNIQTMAAHGLLDELGEGEAA